MNRELLTISEPQLYTTATLADVPFIYQLLLYGEKHGSVLYRSPEEIAAVIDCFAYLKRVDGQYVACASFEPYELPNPEFENETIGEVRSAVSTVAHAGYGAQAIYAVLQKAKNLGIKDIYATTTPDKIPYFEKLGFEKKRGGDNMLWMKLKTLQEKPQISVAGRVRPAFPADIKRVFSMMTSDSTLLSMTEKTLEHWIESMRVFEDMEGNLIGSVVALVYNNRIGGRPRMAEVRGLTVDEHFKERGIENLLLYDCWREFKDLEVVQAFTTAPIQKAQMLLSGGFFDVMPGNKSVLWWDGTVNDII